MKSLLLGMFLSGCAPLVREVHAILPAQTLDSPVVWVEIYTNQKKVNGVYRCVDNGQQPVCRRAVIVKN